MKNRPSSKQPYNHHPLAGARRKVSFQQMVPLLLLLLLGGICGFFIGRFVMTVARTGASTGMQLLLFGMLTVAFCVILLAQILLHEAGHMLAGWLSGYTFCSFRIGSLMWVRQAGHVKLRRLSLAGTGGQCLMNPPEPRVGRFPFVLYNLGGSLLNLLTAPVFWLASRAAAGAPVFAVLLEMAAWTGFGFALINGIPLRLAAVDNDGRNIITLRQNPKASAAFWLQMRVNAMMAEGHRQKDLPAEWFTMPDAADMNNSMVASMAVFSIGRMIDCHAFDQAEHAIESVLTHGTAMAGIHRLLLTAETICLELLGQARPERIAALRTRDFVKFEKAMRTFPTILRMQYGLALRIEKDADKAAALRRRIEKVLAAYPYPGEAEAERELIALLDAASTPSDSAEEPA